MTNNHEKAHIVDRSSVVADFSGNLDFKNVPPEGEFRKLPQDIYDTVAEIHKNSGNEFLTIANGVDTSNIKLDETIKHDFQGRNIVFQLPPGSKLGDRSIIVSDAIIDNATIGVDVVAGDNVIISNSHIGADFEAGYQLSLIECHVEMRLKAIHAERIEGCCISPVCDINRIDILGNNNTIAPWFATEEIASIGDNNHFIGDDPLPVPANKIGKNNKRVKLGFDDVDCLYEPASLHVNSKKMAQRNGFEALEATMPRIKQNNSSRDQKRQIMHR